MEAKAGSTGQPLAGLPSGVRGGGVDVGGVGGGREDSSSRYATDQLRGIAAASPRGATLSDDERPHALHMMEREILSTRPGCSVTRNHAKATLAIKLIIEKRLYAYKYRDAERYLFTEWGCCNFNTAFDERGRWKFAKKRRDVVYFIKSSEFIKVGVAGDLRSRMSVFECSNPLEVILLADIAGGISLEKMIHKQIGLHRHKGEWYRDTSDVRQVMARLIKVQYDTNNSQPGVVSGLDSNA